MKKTMLKTIYLKDLKKLPDKFDKLIDILSNKSNHNNDLINLQKNQNNNNRININQYTDNKGSFNNYLNPFINNKPIENIPQAFSAEKVKKAKKNTNNEILYIFIMKLKVIYINILVKIKIENLI